jgi:hypothetical protein
MVRRTTLIEEIALTLRDAFPYFVCFCLTQ